MMNIQNNGNDLAFCSKRKTFSFVRDYFLRHKNLTAEERNLQRMKGRMAGMDAKTRGVDECREIIIRETLAGNFDYVKGFNEEIGSDLAKKAYSTIGK